MSLEIIEDNVRVSLHVDSHEKLSRRYYSDNSNNRLLFRFDVETLNDGKWQLVEDASYCTLLTADLSTDKLQRALNYLAGHIIPIVKSGESLKKTCEYLSWVRADWF